MPPKLTTGQRNAATIARLEKEKTEHTQKYHRLRDEHYRARAQAVLTHALAAASDALHCLLAAASAAGPDRAAVAATAGQALEECEQVLASLRQQIWPRRSLPPSPAEAPTRSGGEPLPAAAAAAGNGSPGAAAAGGGGAQSPASSLGQDGSGGRPQGGANGSTSSADGPTAAGSDATDKPGQPPPPPPQQQQQQLAWDGRKGAVSVAAFFHHVMQARGTQVNIESFVRWWQERATRLGTLLHQRSRSTAAAAGSVPAAAPTGAASREIDELWIALGAAPIGLLLSGRPWVAQLFGMDLEAPVKQEAASALWDRILACIDPTPQQGLLLALLHGWWHRRNALQKERLSELLQTAHAAPSSYEAQTSLIAGLERAQAAYVKNSAAAMAVLLSALLAPDQCAELFAMSWPHVPCMTALLDRWHSQCAAAHAAAAAATTTAQQQQQRAAGPAANNAGNGNGATSPQNAGQPRNGGAS